MAINTKRYKYSLYQNDGTFVQDVQASFSHFGRSLNGGDGITDLSFTVDYNDDTIDISEGYEIKIYDNYDQQYIYSGFILNIQRPQQGQLIASATSWATRLEETHFLYNCNRISWLRDGTLSAYDSLDTKKTSDQVKFLVNNFRFLNGDIITSNESGSSHRDWGSTTRQSQSFTTGSTAEKSKVVGAWIYARWNGTGTNNNIGFSIKANDGSNKPTGADLNVGLGPNLASTDFQWIPLMFDEPIQLSTATKYHFIMTAGDSSGAIYEWKLNSGGNPYSGGTAVTSTDSGATWTVQTNDDFYFRMIYVDESKVRINYTTTSIDDSDDSRKYTFSDQTIMSAIKYIQNYGPASMNFYVDANYTVHYHRAGFTTSIAIDHFDDSSTFSTVSNITSIAENSSTKREGNKSIQVVLANSGATHSFRDTFASPKDLTGLVNYGGWVLVPSDTQFYRLTIRLETDSSNYVDYYIQRPRLSVGVWNWITPMIDLGRTPDNTVGTFDITSVASMVILIDSTITTETTTWYFDDFVAGTVASTDLIRDVNVKSFTAVESIENLRNMLIFSNNNPDTPLLRIYQDADSIAKYGVKAESKVDGRVTQTDTADAIGGDFLAKNSTPMKSVENIAYVGDTRRQLIPNYFVRFRNYEQSIGVELYYVITAVDLSQDDVQMTVEEYGKQITSRISDTQARLDLLESAGASTGDTPTTQGTNV